MTKKDKLLKRFCSLPKDFTFEEAVTLFGIFGFSLDNKGGTSGSRVGFRNEADNAYYTMHRPHPDNRIKSYQMEQILKFLHENGYLK